jgi:double-strand break repair protein MRE11
VRPAEAPQLPQDSWFNVFVLHQNRLQHSSSTKNTIREAYLARFLDLVVWGHEHECILDTWVTHMPHLLLLHLSDSLTV